MGATVSKEQIGVRSNNKRSLLSYEVPASSWVSSSSNRTRCDGPSSTSTSTSTSSSSSSSSSPPPPPPPISSSSDDPAPPPPPSPDASPDSIQEAAELVSSIPNPGPYEQMSSECKRVVAIDTFDGFRFDITKGLSPYFVVSHSFWVGTTSLPDGRNTNYTFVTQLADETGKFFLSRVMTDSKSIHGRFHYPLLGIFPAKIDFNITPAQDAGNDQCIAELDVGGPTWTANLKYGSIAGGIAFGVNYLQAITSNFMLGGEGLFLTSQGAGIGNYAFKYTMPAPDSDEDLPITKTADAITPPSSTTTTTTTTSLADIPSSTIYGNFNAAHSVLSLNYKRVVTPNRVTLGAELSCNPFDLKTAEVVLGAEFRLSRSKVHMCVNDKGKIQSTVEAKLGMGQGTPSLQFAAELDHWNDAMKFGYGINIES